MREGRGKVFRGLYIRKPNENIANITPNQAPKSVQINGNPCKPGLADRY